MLRPLSEYMPAGVIRRCMLLFLLICLVFLFTKIIDLSALILSSLLIDLASRGKKADTLCICCISLMALVSACFPPSLHPLLQTQLRHDYPHGLNFVFADNDGVFLIKQ